MIQVALGTEEFQFTRLLEWIDKAIDEGIIPENEEIRVQAGKTKYTPRHKNIKMSGLIPFEELMNGFRESRIGIIHAGMGNILDFIDINRLPIVVPRDTNLGEHYDSHQFDFCDEAKGMFNFPIVYTYEEFVKAIKEYDPELEFQSNQKPLIEFLTNLVEGN